ncbi:hypothetical protein B7463_g12399, partial [Scytalidium lignicola]
MAPNSPLTNVAKAQASRQFRGNLSSTSDPLYMRPTASSTGHSATCNPCLASSSSNTASVARGSDVPSSSSTSLRTTYHSRPKLTKYQNNGSASPNSRHQQDGSARSEAAHTRNSKSKQPATADNLSDSGYDNSVDGCTSSIQTLIDILINFLHNSQHFSVNGVVVKFRVKDSGGSVEMEIPLDSNDTLEQIQQIGAEEDEKEVIHQELETVAREEHDVVLPVVEHAEADRESMQQPQVILKEINDKLECLCENFVKEDNRDAMGIVEKTTQKAESKEQERKALEVKINGLEAIHADDVTKIAGLEVKLKEERNLRREAEDKWIKLLEVKCGEVVEVCKGEADLIADKDAAEDAAEDRIASLEEELTKRRNMCTSLEERCREQEAEFERRDWLKTQIKRQLKKEISQLQTNHTRLKTFHAKFRRNHIRLKKNYTQLQRNYTRLDTDHTRLRRNYTRLKASYTRLRRDHTRLKINRSQLRTNHIRLKINHAQLRRNHTQLETDQLETRYNLYTEIELLQTENANLEEYKEVLQVAFDKSDEEYVAAKQQISLLRRQPPPHTYPHKRINARGIREPRGQVGHPAISTIACIRPEKCKKHGRHCLVMQV